MKLAGVERAKQDRQPIVVCHFGSGFGRRAGVIVDLKRKLRSGRVFNYAVVEWKVPPPDGRQTQEILIAHIKSASESLMS